MSLRITITFDKKRVFEYETSLPIKSIDDLADDILSEMAARLSTMMSRQHVLSWMDAFRPYLLSHLAECFENMEFTEDRAEGLSTYEKAGRSLEVECTATFPPEMRPLIEEAIPKLLAEVPPLTEKELEERLRKHECLWKMVEPVLSITPYEALFNYFGFRYWFTLYATRVKK